MGIDIVLRAIGKDNYPPPSFANRIGYAYPVPIYGVKLILIMANLYTVRKAVVRHVYVIVLWINESNLLEVLIIDSLTATRAMADYGFIASQKLSGGTWKVLILILTNAANNDKPEFVNNSFRP